MIKLRDYLDSRKLTVEQFNQAPDFAFGVYIRDFDSDLVKVKNLNPFMDADVEEVRERLKFGDAEMVLTNLSIIVRTSNERLTNLVSAIDSLNKAKFYLSKKDNPLSEDKILNLVNYSIGLLENITL